MNTLRDASLCLTLLLAACDGRSSAKADPAGESTPTAKTAAAPSENRPAEPALPYRLLGILDPDREKMVAFALKVPSQWETRQSFQRQWEGAVAHQKIYVKMASPDGSTQIEFLPAAQYVFADGPMSNGLRAQKRAAGIPTQMSPNEIPPMQPVAYIKQNMLSYLSQNGMALSDIGNEQTAPQTTGDNQQVNLRGSVDGTLPNGRKARVECRITIDSRQINGDTFYSWAVIPSITQTAADLEEVFAHTLVAQNSIVINPAWQQIEQESQNRGAQMNSQASRQQHEATMNQMDSNTAAMTRGHEQRMKEIKRFGDANTARFNNRMTQMDIDKAAFDSRMADQDRQQRIRVDGIRGESKYVDPKTGEQVKVEDGYNHVYRNRGDATLYLNTNTPIDAGALDWQELQKVELKDY